LCAFREIRFEAPTNLGVGGSWQNAKIWDTIERLYITRRHNGAVPIGGALLRDHVLRPAAVVLAERELTYSGKTCR
jgi:hypothetical protein